MELLGLGEQQIRPPSDRPIKEDNLAAAVILTSTVTSTVGGSNREDRERSEERSAERCQQDSGERSTQGMKALLERGQAPDSKWRDEAAGCTDRSVRTAAGGGGGGDEEPAGDGGDPGWRYFAGRMGREEAEALLRLD